MNIKICTKCKRELPATNEFFSKDKNSRDGLSYWCKECNCKYVTEYTNNHKLERSLYRRLHNQLRITIERRAKGRLCAIKRRNKVKFTLKQFNDLLYYQNFKCAVCGEKFIESKNIHLDHNHKTGQIRSLLCNNCNVGLGFFKDDIILLEKAKYYLSKWSNNENTIK